MIFVYVVRVSLIMCDEVPHNRTLACCDPRSSRFFFSPKHLALVVGVEAD